MRTYQALTKWLMAKRNCEKSGNNDWYDEWSNHIDKLMKTAPSGAGMDNGTQLVEEECSEYRLVFTTSFHHMDEYGGYDGWTEHKVIVKPNLAFEIEINITGRDRNQIKEYLHEVYHCWLNEMVEEE